MLHNVKLYGFSLMDRDSMEQRTLFTAEKGCTLRFFMAGLPPRQNSGFDYVFRVCDESRSRLPLNDIDCTSGSSRRFEELNNADRLINMRIL